MKKWKIMLAVLVAVSTMSIAVFAYDVSFVMMDWNENMTVMIDGTLSTPSANSDTYIQETNARRLRYGSTKAITAGGRADEFELSLTNTGINVQNYDNSYATIRIIMEVYPQNGNSIASNYLDECIAGVPKVIVHYTSNDTSEGAGETTIVRKNYNTSTTYYEITTDYKFFVQKGQTAIDGIAIYPNVTITMKETVPSTPTLRTYFTIYPLVMNTGGQPLTGNDLDEILHVDIDIDMTPVEEEATQKERFHGTIQEYRESLKGKTATEELQLTSGEYLKIALLQNKVMMEYLNDSYVFRTLIYWSILIGLIGVAFGVGTWLRRR